MVQGARRDDPRQWRCLPRGDTFARWDGQRRGAVSQIPRTATRSSIHCLPRINNEQRGGRSLKQHDDPPQSTRTEGRRNRESPGPDHRRRPCCSSSSVGGWTIRRQESRDPAARRCGASRAPGKFVRLTDGVTHYRWTGRTAGASSCWRMASRCLVHLGLDGSRSLAGRICVIRYDAYGRGFSARPDVEYCGELRATVRRASRLASRRGEGRSRWRVRGRIRLRRVRRTSSRSRPIADPQRSGLGACASRMRM